MTYRKKLIEVALPLDAINRESAREKSIRHGHPSTLHLWWARRPLAACRAVLFASLVDDPSNDLPEEEAKQERDRLFGILEELVKWENSNDEGVLSRARAEIRRSCTPPPPPSTDDIEVILEEGFNAFGSRGYDVFGGFDSLAELANARLADYRETVRWRGTLKELRGCLFFEQRRWRHFGDLPEGEELKEIRALYNTIRDRWHEAEPELPPVLDPFCGGGSIPLEAQRLGLEAHGSDLNPVAVLITKALIEIPPKFAGLPPVNPEARGKIGNEGNWRGAKGLAEDVRYYGRWMRDEAEKRIGHLYPKGPNGETVIAWLWARTVRCPNPACGAMMPLVRSFWLSKKQGKKSWVEPVVDREAKEVDFRIATGEGTPRDGTVKDRTATCLVCDSIVRLPYVRAEAQEGRMGKAPFAIVVEDGSGRGYVPFNDHQEQVACGARPKWKPDERVTTPSHDVDRLPMYGMFAWGDAFTPRQLVALTTFTDLVSEARKRVLRDVISSGSVENGVPADDGDSDVAKAEAYADAVATYLGMGVSRLSDICNALCRWEASKTQVRNLFGRQAISMVWDFAEPNVFANAAGNYEVSLGNLIKALQRTPARGKAVVKQNDATSSVNGAVRPVISTDPPYYDNISYADVADFFYVWLRRSLGSIYPSVFGTVLTPKYAELVAAPHRFTNKQEARRFFEEGLGQAFGRVRERANTDYPITIYYAFKQTEAENKNGLL